MPAVAQVCTARSEIRWNREEWSGTRSWRPWPANRRIARFTRTSRINRRSCTIPSRKPASISRSAASGSIPGRPTSEGAEFGDLITQPTEIANAIDARKDVVIRNRSLSEPRTKNSKLPALLRTEHLSSPAGLRSLTESGREGVFNSPRVHWLRNALARAPKRQRTAAAAMLNTIFA